MGLLRFLLALSVVIDHSSPVFGQTLVGGAVAVQSFYIISGFYMSLILNEKYIKSNDSYGLFISNRFLRLYPIYWCILLLTVAASLALFIYSDGATMGKLDIYVTHFGNLNFSTLLFLVFTNIFLFGQDLVMFLGLNTETGSLYFTSNFSNTHPQLNNFLLIPQAWTIGLELTFYLIAPFLVRKKPQIIIFSILLLLILRLFLYKSGLNFDPWTYRFFPTELVFFLLGNLSYRIYKVFIGKNINFVYRNSAYAFIVLFIILWFNLNIPAKLEIYYICFFMALPLIFIQTDKSRLDRYIGELSYPIYMSHIFILMIINSTGISFLRSNGLALTCATVLFSIFINFTLVPQIEKIRQSRLK